MQNDNLVFRTSFLNFPALLFTTALTTTIAIYSVINWNWSLQWVELYKYWIPVPLFGLPAIAFFVVLIFKTFNEKLILTPNYVLIIEGILSWKQDSVRMEYPSIKEVLIEETIPQRILGLGNIRCLTVVSAENNNSTMIGVRNPRAVKDLIMQRITAANQK